MDRRIWMIQQVSIAPVSDIQRFADRLRKAGAVYRIEATVRPSNPLWGPLWERIRKYLHERRSEKLVIKEETDNKAGLNSELVDVAKRFAEGDVPFDEKPLQSIADEAVLMAAAGYGSGKLTVSLNGEAVVISIDDTVASFFCSKDPSPEQLLRVLIEKADELEKRNGWRED